MPQKRSPSSRSRLSEPKAAEEKADQSKLLGLVGYNCRRSYLCILEVYRKRMGKFHLKPVQYSVLALVQSNPNLNQKQLSQTLDIKPPNVATLLDRLEARKLLVRRKDQPDKRFHSLVLTPLGLRVFEEAEATVNSLEREATAALSESERGELMRLLQKVFLAD